MCINQSDLEERAAQVFRMPDIYSNSPVVVWLGPASENSGPAFGAIRHIGENIVGSVDGRLLLAPGAIELR